MILPPSTSCPPNFFTPRRRPALSRPLRDEPPAFLCAMSNYLLLLRRGLLGRSLLGSRLVLVRGLRGRGVLDGRGLLGLGFLLHHDALGRLGPLGLERRRRRFRLGGGLGLRRGFRHGSRLHLGRLDAGRNEARQG